MNDLNFAVFCLIACLLVISSFMVGFVAGFGGFLAYVAGIALFTWLYGALVVNRPRVQPARAFVGVYDGLEYYMEVL